MKILCLQLRRLGDILLCTPAVRHLKETFPHAQIDFMSDPMGRLVLEGNPHISNLFLYDKNKAFQEALRVRGRQYDVVLDFMGNPRTAVLTGISGARSRAGFDHRGRKIFYNFLHRREDTRKYGAVWKLDLLRDWIQSRGVHLKPVTRLRPEIFPAEKDRAMAEGFLKEKRIDSKRLAILAPAHRHPIRQWTSRGFQKTALALAESGAQVFLAWGPGEEGVMESVRRGHEKKIGLLPKTSFREMAALMEKAKVVVTNDSGAMHVAVAVNTPTVTIYGPTHPEDWNPSFSDNQKRDVVVRAQHVACLGCHKSQCPVGHLCMEELPAEDVIQASLKFFNFN